MEAILRLNPEVTFEVITLVPEWFFNESLPTGVEYFLFDHDVGVVQTTPLLEDLPATVERLKTILPFEGERINYLVRHLVNAKFNAVVCDISPLGIAAAAKAGIPAVLIENFTWDWIYEGYLDQEPRLAQFIPELFSVFEKADYHIQSQPICDPRICDLTVGPAARSFRRSGGQIKEMLRVNPRQKLILVTMGGIEKKYQALKRLKEFPTCTFLLPGSSQAFTIEENLVLLPHHSQYYHPDLVNACDAVVGKLGYSTIAEAYFSGIPYGFVPRDHFRETSALAEFVVQRMGGLEINTGMFESGDWVTSIDMLLSQPRLTRREPNGADLIARYLLEKLSAEG